VEWEGKGKGKGKGKRERECYTRRSGWWWACARDINKAGPKSGVEIFAKRRRMRSIFPLAIEK
jgi:hypothetical protein